MRAHRLSTLAMVVVLSGLALAGCAANATPEPTATPTPEPTASTPATEAPTVVTRPSLSFTPWPTVSATPVPTPVPSGTPTPAPSATPTSPAQFCTGSAKNREFFLKAAKGMKTTVYCATGLPAGWALSSGDWAGATVTLSYRYRSTGQRFTLKQGAFCTSSPATCIGGSYPPAGSGTTAFDGKTGQFLQSGTSAYIIAVSPGTTNAYMITSTGVSQSAIATFSANMKAVPKI